ncbi:TetR family transcriptional regulator [Nocardia tenerifensis]|uniref:TetR family transcriptional regulator n=1 Tax=Nocardia tenerifensis TaxID=228006 RepID=A0A318KBP8_9NOCA|nr:TetR/AcrR family transcriptional regulator [Nocardia tenerifensis]PXX71307.1 TetR family transcriptional regulator [Nocardia tenerifensis]
MNDRDLRSDALRNQQELLRAATSAVHREGLRVPLATIAADAGVGIGTLYRHFPTREDLLSELTHRSFAQALADVKAAERMGKTPVERLRLFIDAVISQRDELVLPLHGGPPVEDPATEALRDEIYRVVQRILDQGIDEGDLCEDTTPHDIIAFGALVAQPRPIDPDWDTTCRHLLTTFLRGIHRNP